MILITKLSGKEAVLNAELIETIDSHPDTTISMTSGKKFIVKDTKEAIIDKVIEYKRKIYTDKVIQASDQTSSE